MEVREGEARERTGIDAWSAERNRRLPGMSAIGALSVNEPVLTLVTRRGDVIFAFKQKEKGRLRQAYLAIAEMMAQGPTARATVASAPAASIDQVFDLLRKFADELSRSGSPDVTELARVCRRARPRACGTGPAQEKARDLGIRSGRGRQWPGSPRDPSDSNRAGHSRPANRRTKRSGATQGVELTATRMRPQSYISMALPLTHSRTLALSTTTPWPLAPRSAPLARADGPPGLCEVPIDGRMSTQSV